MIVFEKKLMTNAAHKSQFDAMLGQRKVYNQQQEIILNQYAQSLQGDELVRNARGIFDPLFWAEIDRQAIEIRDNDQGREFMTDLMTLATPLSIGKTVKAYTMAGEIHEEVKVTLDGQAPIGYDHVEGTMDADPVPIFQAGYGVNWRHWQGLQSENIDLVGESQRAKMKVLLSRMADSLLDGESTVRVNGYQSQGIRNHRNTKKIDLTAVGINLVTATNDQIVAFWNQTFGAQLDANYVDALDVVWVSPEIMRRMGAPYSTADGFKEGTLMDYVLRFGRVRSFRRTFKLSGNEFFGYVKDRDTISPLVGAAVSTVPLPRLMPNSNYNFMLWGAMGLQIKADATSKGGVFYAANLT